MHLRPTVTLLKKSRDDSSMPMSSIDLFRHSHSRRRNQLRRPNRGEGTQSHHSSSTAERRQLNSMKMRSVEKKPKRQKSSA